MTLREIRSDIDLILQKSKLSPEFRVEHRHIEYLIHRYRAIGIKEEYKRMYQVDPTWLQNLSKIETTLVNSAEDQSIQFTSVSFSKATLPTIVSLPNDVGLVRVASSSKLKTYFEIPMSRFFELDPDSIKANFDYYFKVQNAIYLYPCTDEISVVAILDNPLDATFLRTEYVNTLEVGESYVVTEGQIIHNSIAYNAGQTFTAVNTLFTGNGKVKYSIQKRNMTIDDQYSMSFTLAEYVSMKILTQEFKIEPQQIADIRSDSNDQLTVLKNVE